MAVFGYGWGAATRGGGGPRSPKVILQPLGVWKAHRMSWSVNGVILIRGPFTLEAHRWPFCGNGVGHEITPFTPEPPGRQVFGYGWGAVIQSAGKQSAGARGREGAKGARGAEARRDASGQGLISWWGPCPLEVPGRPKCGQGPRHRIRPCPSEMRGRPFFEKNVKKSGCIACDIK